jgi:hypothetical protein
VVRYLVDSEVDNIVRYIDDKYRLGWVSEEIHMRWSGFKCEDHTRIGKAGVGTGNDRIRSPRLDFDGTDSEAFEGRKYSGELFSVEGVCGEDEPSDDIGLEGSSSGHEGCESW